MPTRLGKVHRVLPQPEQASVLLTMCSHTLGSSVFVHCSANTVPNDFLNTEAKLPVFTTNSWRVHSISALYSWWMRDGLLQHRSTRAVIKYDSWCAPTWSLFCKTPVQSVIKSQVLLRADLGGCCRAEWGDGFGDPEPRGSGLGDKR